MKRSALPFAIVLVLIASFLPSRLSGAVKRNIVKVDPVVVTTPEGTAPRLPYQIFVKYSDGTSEWRQVKWDNFPRATEDDEADPETHPAGTVYTVTGNIIGDNTTENGYPLTAKVEVVKEAWAVPAAKPVAEPLPLSDVRIIGDNRLTSNRDLDINEILSWDVKQQLYNYRDTYGLSTEGYPVSDGWDSPDTKLKGHGSGHYMSALSFAYASTSDPYQKSQLKERAKAMVDQLRECQEMTFVWSDSLGRYWEARDLAPEEELREMKGTWEAFDEYKKDCTKYGYGYINAIPAQHPALIEMYRAYNNSDWVWAPYYSIHKQLAGLIDIANNFDDKEIADKALLIAKDMGLWVWNRLHYRTYIKTDGDKQERQAKPGNRYEMWNMYIAGEVGGMSESLARLSEMVSDRDEKAKLIEASNCFDSPALFDPLSVGVDDIRTRHANQHIPMIVGALRSYRVNADPYYYNIAYNFWNMMQGRYVYAMGGVGNGEMFRQPYSQMLSMNTNVMTDQNRNMYPNPELNETCCAYNLAKLTKDLNCYDPDNAGYMDYYERVLYNQLVGSVHPEHFGTTYHYAVGMNAIKDFGNDTPQSSCCGGTGSENHVKYQEAAYFVSDNTIWVGLYMPTEAIWRAKGVTLVQDCLWPAEKSVIRIKDGDASFILKLRVPYWATEGFDVKLNGVSVASSYQPCSYLEIPMRRWTSSDVVEVVMPFGKHINFGPDKMDIAATDKNETATPFDPQWVGTVMYGPLAMATPDVTSWFDADINLSPDLSEIQLEGHTNDTGFNGNLYTLSINGMHFQPDYWQTEHSTHYLRLNVMNGPKKKAKAVKVDKTALQQAVGLATERKDAQEAWEAMAVKVPEFSPWAANGYARLMDKLQHAEEVLAMGRKEVTSAKVAAALSSLNMAINTMRPGNLAEPEDLEILFPLLMDSRFNINDKTTELRDAIDYGEMVAQYVNDGSGTKDMIEKALSQLKAARAAMGVSEQ
ncbi:MAG: glycoside hydrolase family 127 protein [Bacteroidia bacterium]|nr:glycoside hydrolase family 127 protein [Bacteroidia bacterium]